VDTQEFKRTLSEFFELGKLPSIEDGQFISFLRSASSYPTCLELTRGMRGSMAANAVNAIQTVRMLRVWALFSDSISISSVA
jgi:hypothetical protein